MTAAWGLGARTRLVTGPITPHSTRGRKYLRHDPRVNMSQMSRAGRARVPIRRPDSRYMRRQHARVTRKLHVDARDFLPHACRRVPDWSSWPPHAMENRMPRTAVGPQTGAFTMTVDSRLEPTNFEGRIWSCSSPSAPLQTARHAKFVGLRRESTAAVDAPV